MKRIVTLLLALLSIVTFTACGSGPDSTTTAAPTTAQQGKAVVYTDVGQGQTEFFFLVKLPEETKRFQVKTDQTTVGAALLELGLIAGTVEQYGLQVETVDGQTLDYDKDRAYWAFYVGENYASKGVDLTEIVPGETYAFEYTKA